MTSMSREGAIFKAILHGQGSDVVLRYGNTSWKLHTWILSMYSPVMAALCDGVNAKTSPDSSFSSSSLSSSSRKRARKEEEEEEEKDKERSERGSMIVDLPLLSLARGEEEEKTGVEDAVLYAAVLRWIYTGHFGSETDGTDLAIGDNEDKNKLSVWSVKNWKRLLHVTLQWLDNNAFLECLKILVNPRCPALIMDEVMVAFQEFFDRVLHRPEGPIKTLHFSMIKHCIDETLESALPGTHCSYPLLCEYMRQSVWEAFDPNSKRSKSPVIAALRRLAPADYARVDDEFRSTLASHLLHLPLKVVLENRPILSAIGFTSEQIFTLLDLTDAANTALSGPFFWHRFTHDGDNEDNDDTSWAKFTKGLAFLQPSSIDQPVPFSICMRRTPDTDGKRGGGEAVPLDDPIRMLEEEDSDADEDEKRDLEANLGMWKPTAARLSVPGDKITLCLLSAPGAQGMHAHKNVHIGFGLSFDGGSDLVLAKDAINVFRPNVPSLQTCVAGPRQPIDNSASVHKAKFSFEVLPNGNIECVRYGLPNAIIETKAFGVPVIPFVLLSSSSPHIEIDYCPAPAPPALPLSSASTLTPLITSCS